MIAIDLGSNTIRVLQIECQTFKRLYSFERAVKTADGLYKTKMISQEAKKRIIDALLDSQKELNFYSDEVVAVTTEALRQAENSKEILDDIFKETGVMFQIISSNLEAELTLLSAKEALKALGFDDDFVLIDIGGGSTEITFMQNSKVISKSFQVGIVTLAQKYDNRILNSSLDEEFIDVKEFIDCIDKSEKTLFIATAGTPTTIANMKLGFKHLEYDYLKITGTRLNIEDLDRNLKILLNASYDEQIEFVGENRTDLIVAGVLIYKKLFELLKFDESIVIDDGLREGVALAKCKGILL